MVDAMVSRQVHDAGWLDCSTVDDRETEMTTQRFEACCAPVTSGVMDEAAADELAGVLKVLADPARLRLLSMVADAETGEVCACDLVEPIGRSQPTVSHHLAALVDAGLLEREKRGRWAWYRLVPERLASVRDALGSS